MKKIRLFFIFSVIITIISACNPNGLGIFYSISTEQKIASSELSDKAVYNIISDGSRLYVLAGSAVYYDNGTTWKKISPPSSGLRAVSLAQLNGTAVYAVYEDDSGSPLKDTIYSLNSTTFVWTADSNTSGISNSIGLQLVSVDHDASIIFITQRTGAGIFSIYSYDGTNLYALSSSDINVPLVGAAKLGTTYYLAASNATVSADTALYSSTGGTGSFSQETITGIDLTSKALGGISENSSATILYLSTKDGYVYSSTDGTAWTAKNTSALTDYYTNTAKLGDMRTVTFNLTDYLIIAGNTGYYEMNLSSGGPVSPVSTATDFKTYDLSKEMIFSVYSDTSDKIYLGASPGLWLAAYNSGNINLDQE